jgi:ATP-dependent helicase HrpB
LRVAGEEGLDVRDQPLVREAVQRCLLVGFSDHLARRLNGSPRCELVHNRRGSLARDSVVDAALFVASEIREVESARGRERNLNVVLNLATAVKQEWLRELFPADFREVQTMSFDPALKRVVARTEIRFRDLVLEEKLSQDIPSDQAAKILAAEVVAGRLSLDNWTDAVEQWILRVNRLHEWMPDLELPLITDGDRASIIEHICHGTARYSEIKNRAVLPVVKSWLSQQQQKWVDEYAPERVQLPNGRMVKVAYTADAPPLIAARIQDLYGIKEGLWIAQRRVLVRIQVLAPSNRPVQVTDNLSLFWRETYPKLKTQLQRRYPKHEWR